MDIRHLCYFVAIADCGSMMRASKRLNVAQPALTVHINNLEVELGVKLMERSNRGVELTDAGRNLYDRAKDLLNLYQGTISSIRDGRTRPSGTVSIGIPSTAARGLSSSLYRRVRDELPDVTLYLTDAGTNVLYEWLVDGRIDFAVLFSLPEDETLDTVPLGMDEFCLVGLPGEAEVPATIDLETIFDLPLVLSSQATTLRATLDDIAERHGKKLSAPVETESIAVALEIIRSGEANGILPLSSVHQEVSQGELIARRLVGPEIRGTLSLASLSSSLMNPAKRAVKDLVTQAGQEFLDVVSRSLPANNVTPMVRTGAGKASNLRRMIGR